MCTGLMSLIIRSVYSVSVVALHTLCHDEKFWCNKYSCGCYLEVLTYMYLATELWNSQC